MNKNLRSVFVAMAVGLGVAAAGMPAHAGGDSPMKKWMKTELQPAKASANWAKVTTLLGALATKNPDAKLFPDWKKFADDGIAAAKKEDKEALNKSCTGCHNAYKKQYKEKFPDGAAP
jgi:hypothetical protein